MEGKVLAFKVQFVSNSLQKGHAEYLVKVISTHGHTFHIRDRYKLMRNFWDALRRTVRNPNRIPDFPPKKWLGNMNQDFIVQRQGELEYFFTTLLDEPEFAKHQMVL